jgi:flagellar biosynthesis protein FlhB
VYRNLVPRRQRRQNVMGQNNGEGNEPGNILRARDHQVIIILLAQVFVFTIGTTPLMVWLFYNAIALSVSNKSADRLAIERMVNVMVEVLVNTFPVFSFYLYTMTSQTFRRELWKLFRFSIDRRELSRSSRVQPTTNIIGSRQITVHPNAIFKHETALENSNEGGQQLENRPPPILTQ